MFLEAGVCSISTMSDLVEMIFDSDKVVTFG
jgi:sulfur relay (sulfurtransferase) complex TusBCD TusD component (DsrE family)